MSLNDEQLDRVGRYLDGEQIVLDAEEKAMADEFTVNQASVANRLKVPVVPAAAMARARGRMLTTAARRSRQLLRWGSTAAAVAAAVVLAIVLRFETTPPQPVAPPIAAVEVPVEVFLATLAETTTGATDSELELVSEELDQLAAEISDVTPTVSIDADMDAFDDSLDNFWTDPTFETLDLEPAEELSTRAGIYEVTLC